MISFPRGSYGILDLDGIRGMPAVLLDGGLEFRRRENYAFDNARRAGYRGYLLQYTLQGRGCFEKQGKQWELTKEKGFVAEFPEESRYYLPEAAWEEGWEFFYLHFEGEGIQGFVKQLQDLSGGCFALSLEGAAAQLALEFQGRRMDGEPLKRYEGSEFLYRFWCELLREIEAPANASLEAVWDGASERVSLTEKALRIIERDYGTLQGVEELAGRLGVSKEHLCRCFRREIGTPPIQYLNQIRIQRAVHELLNTQASVEYIARDCGFSNGNYFGKVFRKMAGMAPGEYRERIKGRS